MEKQKLQYETKFRILLGFNSNNNHAEGLLLWTGILTHECRQDKFMVARTWEPELAGSSLVAGVHIALLLVKFYEHIAVPLCFHDVSTLH